MQPLPRFLTKSALAISALGAVAAAQTTIHVPADFASIQAGINAAVNGDTVLVAPGTYDEWDLRTNGKRITIRGSGGAAATIIDGNDNNRVFFFTGGETNETVLDGFTIRDGYAPHGGGTVGDGGGGILAVNAAPWIKNCVITSCRADYGQGGPNRGGHGGGLYIVGGSPRIENCSITANYAGTGGQGNTGAAGSNGGIFSSPDPGRPGGTGGNGGHGGGIYIENASPTILNCYLVGNVAGRGGRGGTGGRGGNGWLGGAGAAGGRGGRGGRGGEGGAIYVASGSPKIVNSTLVSDRRGDGGYGGTGGAGGSSGGTHGAQGSTGTAGNCGGLSAGNLTSFQNSISWSHVGVPLTGPSASFCNLSVGYGGVGNISAFPMLSGTMPAAGSPCIDAGNSSLLPAWASGDLDGNPRDFDDPFTTNTGVGSIDIGCSERVGSYVLPYGCGNPGGSLVLQNGTPTPGATLSFLVTDDEPRLGARAALIVGTAPDPASCGTQTRGGYLQVDVTQPFYLVMGGEPGAQTIDLVLPPDSSLVGQSLFVQGASIAPRRLRPGSSSSGGPLTWSLLESVQLVVGP